jgi:hypothetical protein
MKGEKPYLDGGGALLSLREAGRNMQCEAGVPPGTVALWLTAGE